MFADDTNVFLSGPSIAELENSMNTELALLYDWLCTNKLSLNITKTHYILFQPPKRNVAFNIRLHIDHKEILKVDTTKFLGVLLDSKLSWKPHINYNKYKISKSKSTCAT